MLAPPVLARAALEPAQVLVLVRRQVLARRVQDLVLQAPLQALRQQQALPLRLRAAETTPAPDRQAGIEF